MTTDDERRKVAARLREYVDLPDDWWHETSAEFYVEKCAFGNVERHRESELFARLADLIAPAPERTCYPVLEDGTLVCSECGEDIDGYGWNYCPNCGAKVVDE